MLHTHGFDEFSFSPKGPGRPDAHWAPRSAAATDLKIGHLQLHISGIFHGHQGIPGLSSPFFVVVKYDIPGF